MKTIRVVAAVIRAVNNENKPVIFATREATESSRAAGSFRAARLSLVRHRSRR